MAGTNAKPAKSSKKARMSAARLAAVQAVYQMMANEQKAESVIEEYRVRRFGKPVDGQAMVMPEQDLFADIVNGVEARRAEIEAILVKPEQKIPAEPLLRSILLCGTWELLAQENTDTPLIIAEYLNVTHAFFGQGESRMINGVLDRVKGEVRGKAS